VGLPPFDLNPCPDKRDGPRLCEMRQIPYNAHGYSGMSFVNVSSPTPAIPDWSTSRCPGCRFGAAYRLPALMLTGELKLPFGNARAVLKFSETDQAFAVDTVMVPTQPSQTRNRNLAEGLRARSGRSAG